MPAAVWRSILSEVKDWPKEHKKGLALCFHGAGEPLLHPELKNILEEARKIPGVSIGFMTNAMLLNEDWAIFLVDLPVDWLWFSIDGAFPETNDNFRKGSRLTVIERNVLNLIEKRERKGNGRPLLSFNMVAYPKIDRNEIELYVRRWLPYAALVSISRFRPLGSKRLLSPEERAAVKRRPCPLLYRQMVVAWDGTAGLCCEDIHLEVPLGRVSEKNIA